MTQESIDRICVPMWANELQYGTPASQYVALVALRSHGHTCHGVGHGDDFYYEWMPPDKNIFCHIEPFYKHDGVFIELDRIRLDLLAWVQAHFIQRYEDQSVVSHNEGMNELLEIILNIHDHPVVWSEHRG